jgi:hypothetical protein
MFPAIGDKEAFPACIGDITNAGRLMAGCRVAEIGDAYTGNTRGIGHLDRHRVPGPESVDEKNQGQEMQIFHNLTLLWQMSVSAASRRHPFCAV